MQKLLSERKKVKTLEEALQKQKNATPSPLENLPSKQSLQPNLHPEKDLNELHQKEHEIQLLKKIVHELGTKLKHTEEVSKDQLRIKDEEISQIQQKQVAPAKEILAFSNPGELQEMKKTNFHLQNELVGLRERIHEQEEEITRLQQFRQAELLKFKEQQSKTFQVEEEKLVLLKEIERLKEDLTRERTSGKKTHETSFDLAFYKEEIEKLQKTIITLGQQNETRQASTLNTQQEALKFELEETKKKMAQQELELEDHKLLLRDLSHKNKAAETKQQSHHHLVEAIQKELSEALQQLKQKELLYKEVIREKETLLKTCKELEQTLSKEKDENKLLEQDLHDAEHAYEKSLYKIADLEKKVAHSTESQKLVDEKLTLKETRIQELSQQFEASKKEILALEGKLAEQKSDIETLEQHLARRVKECAELSEIQETQKNTIKNQELKLGEKEELLQALKETLAKETEHFQEKEKHLTQAIEALENESLSSRAFIDEQASAIDSLKQLEKRYFFLEELLGQAQSTFSNEHTFKEEETPYKNPPKKTDIGAPKAPVPPKSASFFSQNPEFAKKEESPKKADLFSSQGTSLPPPRASRHDLFQ
jgi:hypothetical protein